MPSTLPQKPHLISPEAYLAWDAEAAEKWEYVDGEIFTLTGTTVRHNEVAGNVYLALRNHLNGQPCRTFVADIKVHAARANAFYYPDVVVRCNPAPPADDETVTLDSVNLTLPMAQIYGSDA